MSIGVRGGLLYHNSLCDATNYIWVTNDNYNNFKDNMWKMYVSVKLIIVHYISINPSNRNNNNN